MIMVDVATNIVRSDG